MICLEKTSLSHGRSANYMKRELAAFEAGKMNRI